MDYRFFIIKNNNIETNEKIFETIAKINIELQKLQKSSAYRKILPVIFNEDIKFISPLFFSLLLQIHERYIIDNVVLVIDILNFTQDEKYQSYAGTNDPRQHFVHRILLSMNDTPYFESYRVDTERIEEFRENIPKIFSNNSYDMEVATMLTLQISQIFFISIQ